MAALLLSSLLLLTLVVRPSSASCSPALEEKLATYNCTCVQDNETGSHVIASCLNASLVSVPPDLPTTPPFDGLHLEGNSINYLKNIPYPNVRRVILSNNSIKCHSDDVFSNFTEVESLVLSKNAFRLEPNMFRGMKSLKMLTLDDNPLYELENLTFSGNATPVLKHLSISNCRLSQSAPFAFHKLQQLEVLDASHNRLSAPIILNEAPSLHTLNLSYNWIDDLSALPSTGVEQVVILHLDHNRLTSISASVFQGLSKLKVVALSYNQLAEIHPATFDNLLNLNTIYLDHNELKTFQLNDEHLTSLHQLQVHHNRWHCGCEIGWMRDHDKVKEFNPPEQMLCDSPYSVHGQSLFEVDIHKFDCPGMHHGLHNNAIALALGIVVSVIIMVALSFLIYRFILKQKKSRGNVANYQEVDWGQSEDRYEDRLNNHL